MRKSIKTLFASALAAVVSTTCFACGGDPGSDESGEVPATAGSIVVKVFDGGYSTSWINKIARQFTRDTGIGVNVKDTTNTGGWDDELTSGVSNVDIYFNNAPGFSLVYKDGLTVGGKRYEICLADLTDMYNTEVPGEGVLYKDKMIPSVRDALDFDMNYDIASKTYLTSETGKFYTSAWSNGSLSFVVNMDKWKSDYGEFPNTTDELFSLCGKVIADQKSVNVNSRMYPFGYSIGSSYWKFIFETWATQYFGADEYAAFNAGYDANGNRYTKELLRYDAFLESLEVLDECIKARGDNNAECYSHPNSRTDDFTTAQFRLLNGTALMQPNGNWLMSEMNSSYSGQDLNVCFKKVPVISAIRKRCPTVGDDAELSAVIKAIDGGSESLTGDGYDVSREDFDRINYARRTVTTTGAAHGAYIPVYSANVDLAKRFLLYMAKDESLEIYYKETLGSTLPFVYDYSKADYSVSRFIASERQMLADSDMRVMLMAGNNKLAFFNQTLFNPMHMPYQIAGEAETLLAATNLGDRKTARELFDLNYDYAVKNWGTVYEPYTW